MLIKASFNITIIHLSAKRNLQFYHSNTQQLKPTNFLSEQKQIIYYLGYVTDSLTLPYSLQSSIILFFLLLIIVGSYNELHNNRKMEEIETNGILAFVSIYFTFAVNTKQYWTLWLKRDYLCCIIYSRSFLTLLKLSFWIFFASLLCSKFSLPAKVEQPNLRTTNPLFQHKALKMLVMKWSWLVKIFYITLQNNQNKMMVWFRFWQISYKSCNKHFPHLLLSKSLIQPFSSIKFPIPQLFQSKFRTNNH